jgi:predicted amidohydrolase
MARILRVAAAQLGPNHRTTKREDVLQRMLTLLQDAASKGAKLVLFPELAFVTFFPRYILQPEELDTFFEHDSLLISPSTYALFVEARKLGVDISVGYAERTADGKGYNTSIYYSASADSIISKYRKIHLPGTFEPFPEPGAINQLEKRYFSVGDLGFTAFRAPDLVPSPLKQSCIADQQDTDGSVTIPIGKGDAILGALICNDRRWPEAWRSLSLQGTELVLCGYNTQGYCPELAGTSPTKPQSREGAEAAALEDHILVMRANSYMNSVFSVCAAKAGLEDGQFGLIGGSCIVDPKGVVLALAKTRGDEIIVADCDLGEVIHGRQAIFDYARHRRIEAYSLITTQTGVIEPPLL